LRETKLEDNKDHLLGCLEILCKLEEREFSPKTAIAGLPLVNNCLVPTIFERAAERLGFTARIVARPLTKIPKLVLPVILLLDDDKACVMASVLEDERIELMYPGEELTPVHLTLSELEKIYTH